MSTIAPYHRYRTPAFFQLNPLFENMVFSQAPQKSRAARRGIQVRVQFTPKTSGRILGEELSHPYIGT